MSIITLTKMTIDCLNRHPPMGLFDAVTLAYWPPLSSLRFSGTRSGWLFRLFGDIRGDYW